MPLFRLILALLLTQAIHVAPFTADERPGAFTATAAAAATASGAGAQQPAKRGAPYAPGTLLVRLRQTSGSGSRRRLAAALGEALLPGVAPVRFVGQHHTSPLPRPAGSGAVVAAAAAAAAAVAAAPDGAVLQLRITDGSSVEWKAAQLMQHPDVEIAEPDFARRIVLPAPTRIVNSPAAGGLVVAASATGPTATTGPTSRLPNDPFFFSRRQLWHMNRISAPLAWATTTGSLDVGVCIIDTGIRADHEDFQRPKGGSGPRIVKGWNRACPTCTDGVYTGDKPAPGSALYNDVTDAFGHGTHVAGIISAATNNSRGVAGVAWRASLYVCLVSSPDGLFYTSSLLDCYSLCRKERVRIVSNSYYSDCEGSPCYSQLEYDAINELGQGPHAALFVAAAGNFGMDTDAEPKQDKVYPASYLLPNVLSIAATTQEDTLSSFSNYGRTTVHMAAPGSDILSLWYSSKNSYISLSGTSMATPLVAGAAALLWSARPNATMAEVRRALLDSVDPVPALARKCTTGGRLNVARALLRLLWAPRRANKPQPRYRMAVSPSASAPIALPAYTVCEVSGLSSAACEARCLAQPWCFYFLTGPVPKSLTVTCRQRPASGSCLLVGPTARLGAISSRAGYSIGFKGVDLRPAPSPPPPSPPTPPLPSPVPPQRRQAPSVLSPPSPPLPIPPPPSPRSSSPPPSPSL